jgi:hypothetical protein
MARLKYFTNAIFILLLAGLLWTFASPQLEQEFYPDGDFAADMLLVNQLHDDRYLLTGHYSRFGFNHPGPVFLYTNALFEKIGTVFKLPRANSWLLSCLTVNFLLLLLMAWSVARLFDKKLSLTALAATLPVAVLLSSNLFYFWMPYRLILPFAVFYLSLLLVLANGLRFLPLAMTTACILIHGYVTMPIFTLPILGLATLIELKRNRLLRQEQICWLGVSVVIGALFFMPMLIDFIINPHSNLLRILAAQHSFKNSETATLEESAVFALSYWRQAAPVTVPAFLLFLTLGATTAQTHRKLLITAAGSTLLLSTIFIVYHSSVPKPLYDFMGLYYLGVPLALSALLIYATLQAIQSSLLRKITSIALAISMLLWLATFNAPSLNQRDDIRQLGAYIKANFGNQVVIDYPVHNDSLWGTAEGLLVYLKDRGVNACVARPNLDFMYTKNGVCKKSKIDIYLNATASCAPNCLFSVDQLALHAPPLSKPGESVLYPACELPRLPTTYVEDDCKVTTTQTGFVTFGPYVRLSPGHYGFKVEYSSSSPSNQVAGRWDVAINKGQDMLSEGVLQGTDGRNEQLTGEFFIKDTTETEIRTYLNPGAALTIAKISITRK